MTLRSRLSYYYLVYLRGLAKIQLHKNRPLIIGITGSAGKTSLRKAVTSILKNKYKVKESIKANSESGIPLNILGIKPKDYSLIDWLRMGFLAPFKLLTNWEKFDVYIAELGIDSPHPPKNMQYLLTILQPQIGIFLNALPVHTQFFDELIPENIKNPKSREKLLVDLIAQEKGKLILSLPENGTAVLNLDDPRVAGFVGRSRARSITFSTTKPADLVADDIHTGISGFSMRVKEGKQIVNFKIKQLLELHYARTLMAAIAIGRTLDISLAACVNLLEKNFRLPPGRMSVFPGIKNSTILDSSYNASPKTMLATLKLLKQITPGRKLAILGDMRELGEIAKLEHEKIAIITHVCADEVITVGPLMQKWFVPKLIDLGFEGNKLHPTQTPYQAAEIAGKIVKNGDTILVKGSQNQIFLEIVVEKLLLNPRKQKKLLCRRGAFWDAKRRALKNL